MKNLIQKYHGRHIEDDGSVTSREFKEFVKDFKKELKHGDFKLEDCHGGHYYLSGFLSKNGKYVYFSYDVPRGNQPMDMTRTDAMEGILIRTAEHLKDYTGGINHFTNFEKFFEDVDRLL